MNITNLLHTIKNIADSETTVRSAYIGDCYTIWNTAEVEYASFVVNVRNVRREDNLRVYNVIVYYADRLLQDNSNRVSLWDDATNTIQSVISELNDIDGVEVSEDYTIELFEQKFADTLAGGYAVLNVMTLDELGDCGLDKIEDEDDPDLPDPIDPHHPIDPGDFPHPGGGGWDIPIH